MGRLDYVLGRYVVRMRDGDRGYVYAYRLEGGGWSDRLVDGTRFRHLDEALKRFEQLSRTMAGVSLGGSHLEIRWKYSNRWRTIWPLGPLTLLALAARGKLPEELMSKVEQLHRS